MDMRTIITTYALVKQIPGSAAERAETAQAAAEAAAALAQQHSVGFSFADGVLTLSPIEEEEE